MNFINLTDTSIRLYAESDCRMICGRLEVEDDAQPTHEFPPAEVPAQVSMRIQSLGCEGDIPMFRAYIGNPEVSAEIREDTGYIVSPFVACAAQKGIDYCCEDLFLPCNKVYNRNGNVVGYIGLARI